MIKAILEISIKDSKEKRMQQERQKELILEIRKELLPELEIIACKMGSLNVDSFTKAAVPRLMDILKEEVLEEASVGNEELTEEVIKMYEELIECKKKETVYL